MKIVMPKFPKMVLKPAGVHGQHSTSVVLDVPEKKGRKLEIDH